MPPHLSPYVREQIIRLLQGGETVASIVKELRKDEISTTHRTVTRRTTRPGQTRVAFSHHIGDRGVPRQDARRR